MTDLYEALKVLDVHSFTIDDYEYVSITQAINRVVNEDIEAKYDMPLFDKATMDGFAFRYNDLDVKDSPVLKIKDAVFAGDAGNSKIGKGECIRIMTGAPVPEDCDTVVEFEKCEEKNGFLHIVKKFKPFGNIAFKGEDIKSGSTVMNRGSLIKKSMINIIVALGIGRVNVKRKLKIGVITTGNELIDIDEPISPGKIKDSSRYSLINQITSINQEYVDFGIVEDDEKAVKDALHSAVRQSDIVLITGGSSFGDKDFTADALREIDADILVRRVAMKPGKPTILSTVKDNNRTVYVFGVPGNPVSTFVVFEIFVKRLIDNLLGCGDFKHKFYTGIMDFDFDKKPDRLHFTPCIIDFTDNEFVIKQIRYNGSGDIAALAKADGFFAAPRGVKHINKGEIVEFLFI